MCWTLNRSRAVRAVHQRWCQRRSMVGVLVVVDFLGSFVALAGCTQADADDGLPVLTSYKSLEPEVLETSEPDPALENEIREALSDPLLIKEDGMAPGVYRLNTATSPVDAALRDDGLWDYQGEQWEMRYPCGIPELRQRILDSGYEVIDFEEKYHGWNPSNESCVLDFGDSMGVDLVIYKYDRSNGDANLLSFDLREIDGFQHLLISLPKLSGQECYAFVETQVGPLGVTAPVGLKQDQDHNVFENFDQACDRATRDFLTIFKGD